MKTQLNFTKIGRSLAFASLALLPLGLAAANDDDDSAGTPVFTGSSGDFLGVFPRPDVGGPLQGFYFGAAPGIIATDYADSVNDGSVSMVRDDDDGFAITFFTGYTINEFFAVEASFTKSDDVSYRAMSDGSGISWSAGPVSAQYDAEFFTLAGLVRYPVAPRWWAFGKVGITWWETTETFNESGFISTDNDSGEEIFVALGLEFDPGEEDRALYRFEVGYQPVGGDDDLDIITASVGFRYEFP